MNKPKKIPMRKCIATNEQFPKKELIRVVKTPEGKVVVDLTGKVNGRGAYISKSLKAVDICEKKKLFEKHLEIQVEKEVYSELRKLIGEAID